MLENYLMSILGKDSVLKEPLPQVEIPIYLKRYSFCLYEIYGQKYVFVDPQGKVNLKTYKNQKAKIENIFQCPAVLVLRDSFTAQRTNLIENKIMFVEEGKQLFMPMSGLVLKNNSNTKRKLPDKFTPQTQICSLYFLYSATVSFTATEISDGVRLNRMAVSRAMQTLTAINAVTAYNEGNKQFYRLASDKKTFYNCIKDMLINPVQKEVMIKRTLLPNNVVAAGYSALSVYSLLTDNEMETYALYKKEDKDIAENSIIEFEDLLYGSEYVRLQLWKYDPFIFAKDNAVDKISLCLTIENPDERTEEVIERLMEEVLNG